MRTTSVSIQDLIENGIYDDVEDAEQALLDWDDSQDFIAQGLPELEQDKYTDFGHPKEWDFRKRKKGTS